MGATAEIDAGFPSHFTGVKTGAPFVLTKKAMNFAGSVALAFLETT